MTRRVYEPIIEGENEHEWIAPYHRDFRLMCCDCGLVHSMDFRINQGQVEFRIKRNERATASARKGAKKRSK